MTRLRCVAVTALVALLGCSSKVVPISITVLTKKCSTAGPNPTDGVDHFKVVITAADFDPISKVVASGSAIEIDQIPPGTKRQLTLTGYAGDPSGTTAVPKAYGQSPPFDVPTDTNSKVQVTILLRAADAFAGVPTLADPTKCASMTTPRAGHTATLLSDGRVLISGGYQLKAPSSDTVAAGSSPGNWKYLDAAEIFDPATNTSTAVATMTPVLPGSHTVYDSPAAFHSAALLPDGTVLVTGGEEYIGSATGFSARENTLNYDPGADTWTYGTMSAPEFLLADGGGAFNIARSRHATLSDAAGHVVIAGGVSYAQAGSGSANVEMLVPQTLWLDGTSPSLAFHAVQVALGTGVAPPGPPALDARVNFAAAALLQNTAVALAGGDTLDGGFADPPILFFQYSATQSSVVALPLEYVAGVPQRTHGALAALGPEQHLMVFAGGSGVDGGLVQPTAIIDSTAEATQFTVTPTGSRGRNDPCAVALQDGRVLVAGGATSAAEASDLGDLYSETFYANVADGGGTDAGASVTPTATVMTEKRVFHTCTVLRDGSVLITGGARIDSGKYDVLDSMELYTPAPLK